ncbi:hypothetical protein C9980_19505 [Vibrio mediterranei]|uniref:hypothetical protein n=1 Tax=Vibrio mediterranei TaxID=689 RepID=UPI000D185E1F|nr:hypothetical protein [Vibrio mediterranei]PTC03201.1 hypothetical protein C9980_19505 [Vibrio mediterranei]
MIFSTEYFNTREPVHGDEDYEGVPLDSQLGPYLSRSLSLIHNVCDKWITSNEEFSLLPFEMQVPSKIAEEALEHLFVGMHDIATWISQGEGEAIVMMSRYDKGSHVGVFLVKHHLGGFTHDVNGVAVRDYVVLNQAFRDAMIGVLESFQGVSGRFGRWKCSGTHDYHLNGASPERAHELFQYLSMIASVRGIQPSKVYRFQVRYGRNTALKEAHFD